MAVYNFTVLKETQKGALLITNGVTIAWVQGRARRKDGTFGNGALRALTESTIKGASMEDFDFYNKQKVSAIQKWQPEYETEKAWLIAGVWMPKSLCTLTKNADKTYTISGPRWILRKVYTEEALTA